jgi:hypothetical protein
MAGTPVSQSVDFGRAPRSASAYPVSFSETGLPPGLVWSVSLNGTTRDSLAGDSIAFSLPNGSYAFAVPASSGYLPYPASGFVSVDAGSAARSVVFSRPSGSTGGPPSLTQPQGLPAADGPAALGALVSTGAAAAGVAAALVRARRRSRSREP